ncbi:MAG: DUF423 domain-containing protein [Alphaproteobacteria bacterium]|nr:DUF423 domain-containing protein [Alphaproteobacteria bacterium]
MRTLMIAVAVSGFLLTVLGAMGGHAPAGAAPDGSVWVFDERAWQSATVFGFAHVLAAGLAAMAPVRGRLRLAAGWAFLAGVLLFAVSLMTRQLLMAGYVPAAEAEAVTSRYAGFLMTVPFGGLCFMAGWILFAFAVWRGASGARADA